MILQAKAWHLSILAPVVFLQQQDAPEEVMESNMEDGSIIWTPKIAIMVLPPRRFFSKIMGANIGSGGTTTLM